MKCVWVVVYLDNVFPHNGFDAVSSRKSVVISCSLVSVLPCSALAAVPGDRAESGRGLGCAGLGPDGTRGPEPPAASVSTYIEFYIETEAPFLLSDTDGTDLSTMIRCVLCAWCKIVLIRSSLC